MTKVNELVDYGGAWVNADPDNRDALVITRDGRKMGSGVSCDAKHIASMLLCMMSDNAELCEGVKLAAKHYDSLGASQHEEKAKPDGKKVLS